MPNGSDPDEPKDGMNPQKTPREAAETPERQNKTSSPPAEIEDIRSQTSDFNFWILDCGSQPCKGGRYPLAQGGGGLRGKITDPISLLWFLVAARSVFLNSRSIRITMA